MRGAAAYARGGGAEQFGALGAVRLELGGAPATYGLDGGADGGGGAPIFCRWDRGADDDHARAAVTDGAAFVGADGGVYGECRPPGDALYRGAANVEVSATAAAR